MKKIYLCLIAFLGLMAATVALASPEYSSFTSAKKSPIGNLKYPTTDITVINATNHYINVYVPGGVNDQLPPGINEHITAPNRYDPTHLILSGVYTFFNQNVCRAAIVTVFWDGAVYHPTLDNEYCY